MHNLLTRVLVKVLRALVCLMFSFSANVVVNWQWPEEVRAELRAVIPKSQRSVFGAAERRPDDIGYVSDWGLFVNMKEQDLLSDVPKIRN